MSNVKAYLEDIVRDGLHDIAEALKGGGPAGDVQASHVSYDNETSGLLGTNAQEAIDELSTKVNTNASGISDLTTRIGTAEGDITALDGRLDTAEGNITSLDGRLDTAEEDITALETWKDNLDASDIPYGSGTVKDALDTMPKKIGYVNVDISRIAINLADSGWYYALVTIPNIPTDATCFSVTLGNFDANVIVNVGTGNKIVLQSPVSKTLPSPRNVRVFYYL